MLISTNQSLWQAFEQSCRSWSARCALNDIETGESLSYQELLKRTQLLIQWLKNTLTLEPGQRVGLLMHNRWEWVVSYFALSALGCVVVPLNWRLTSSELQPILNDAAIHCIITETVFHSTLQQLKSINQVIWVGDTMPAEGWVFPTLSDEFLPTPSVHVPRPEELAVLVYTSGTTGRSKGVMLSHRNMLTDMIANQDVIEANEYDVFITTSPLFHVFGMTNVMLTALCSGATLLILPKFSPTQVLKTISEYKVTFLAAVPTMYQLMLMHLPNMNWDLSSLRVCHSGAAPMAKTLFEQIETTFGAPVQEGYGQSEASSIVTSNPLQGPRKPGSIGMPLKGITVEIVDDSGHELPPNKLGELRVKGDTVMLGYWQRPELTQQSIRDGWLYTKDLGYRDEQGYIYLVDRRDDLINVGGVNVFPREIEEALYRHPSVQRCAVKAVPSALHGQIPVAYVVKRDGFSLTEAELEAWCRESLASFKCPKAFIWVDDIPVGATGKVLRHQLPPISIDISLA